MDRLKQALPFGALDIREQIALSALDQGPDWTERGLMICPSCESSQIHIVTTGTQQADTAHLLFDDGVHVIRPVPEIGVGSAIVTLCQCDICLTAIADIRQFHRGQTFTRTQVWDVESYLPGLWRT